MMNDAIIEEQKKAIEAFLLVECRREDCERHWCKIQAKILKAFGYPDDWKIQNKIITHHHAFKKLSLQLKNLAEENLSAETLKKGVFLTNNMISIFSCLYEHFRPSPIEIQSGVDNFKELLSGVIGSGEDFVILSEKGEPRISGGVLGDDFDSFSLCAVCYFNSVN